MTDSICIVCICCFSGDFQSGFTNFPCVFKVGHAHAGMGKVKVESEKGFQVSSSYFMHDIDRDRQTSQTDKGRIHVKKPF